jgi:hypothetical protein
VLVVEMTLTDPMLYASPQRRTAYFQRMSDTATLEYACSAEHWLEELEKNRVSTSCWGFRNSGLKIEPPKPQAYVKLLS